MMLTVMVNGERTQLPARSSVVDLVGVLGLPDRGIAVAIDDEVVPRGQWDRLLHSDARIEIVTAVQGG